MGHPVLQQIKFSWFISSVHSDDRQWQAGIFYYICVLHCSILTILRIYFTLKDNMYILCIIGRMKN